MISFYWIHNKRRYRKLFDQPSVCTISREDVKFSLPFLFTKTMFINIKQISGEIKVINTSSEQFLWINKKFNSHKLRRLSSNFTNNFKCFFFFYLILNSWTLEHSKECLRDSQLSYWFFIIELWYYRAIERIFRWPVLV